ncbi:putative lipoprotein [Selenomonas sp. FOBRC6]|uniref:hypothetical protein n=1 Tax=Selenomonas sp. FOBRC6 TaxID=936572 RepID=UPI0002781DCB|nr:hypothetical protein [Selenomonas sp. FOBRC6]EJO23483.1 putative lipoprotein [Selenomonas sp. FOBRC6]
MKKMIAGLFAGLILATGAQVLAYGCEGGVCELPQRENKAYCYDNGGAYCYGDRAQSERGDRTYARGGCGCARGR